VVSARIVQAGMEMKGSRAQPLGAGQSIKQLVYDISDSTMAISPAIQLYSVVLNGPRGGSVDVQGGEARRLLARISAASFRQSSEAR
jgi:hypothetical protein